jgi:predicted ester cyclase
MIYCFEYGWIWNLNSNLDGRLRLRLRYRFRIKKGREKSVQLHYERLQFCCQMIYCFEYGWIWNLNSNLDGRLRLRLRYRFRIKKGREKSVQLHYERLQFCCQMIYCFEYGWIWNLNSNLDGRLRLRLRYRFRIKKGREKSVQLHYERLQFCCQMIYCAPFKVAL